MSAADFDRALVFTLRHEGGKSDDPRDPGGRTAFGVTQATFDAFADRRGLARRDVWTIEETELRDIYRAGYWDALRCDGLEWPLSLVVFECAVNPGTAAAREFMEGSAWRPVPTSERCYTLIAMRWAYYLTNVRRDARKAVFLKGWLNRCRDLAKECGL